MTFTEEQLAVLAAWENSRHNAKIKQFAKWVVGQTDKYPDIRYIAAYNSTNQFVKIVQDPNISGPHSAPYFALSTDAQLTMARFIITDGIPLWDFKTAKKLNSYKVQKTRPFLPQVIE